MPPQIINGRTMVPIRKIAEILGGYIDSDYYNIVYLVKSGIYLGFQVEKKSMKFESKDIPLDVAPLIVKNKMLVPMRAIADALDIKVAWDQKKNAVFLTSGISSHYMFSDICSKMVSEYDSGKYGEEMYYLTCCPRKDVLIHVKDKDATITMFEHLGRYKTRKLSKKEFREFTFLLKITILID